MTNRSLYKFKSLATSKDHDDLRAMLLEPHVFLSSRTNFNDPFDCRVSYIDTSTREEKIQWLIERYLRDDPELDPMAARSRALLSAENAALRGVELEQTLRSKINDSLDLLGICCLAASRTSILLWSHYADAHRGVCLEYRSPAEGDPISAAREVIYSDAYPAVDVLRDRDPARFETILLRKSAAWSYEQEWRIVHPTRTNFRQEIPPACLVGVTLGARITARNATQVREWATASPSSINVQYASLSSTRYGLDFAD